MLIASTASFCTFLFLFKVIHQPNHITQRIGAEVSPSNLIAADEDDDIIPGIEVANDHVKRDVVLGADFISVVSVDD